MSFESNQKLLVGVQHRMVPEVIKGVTVEITVDDSETRFADKYAAFKRAIELVSERAPVAFGLLKKLHLYCSKDVNNEACWVPDDNTTPKDTFMFLGDSMFLSNRLLPGQDNPRSGMGESKIRKRGVADQIGDMDIEDKDNPEPWWKNLLGMDQKSKVPEKATAVVVHEIGHILHERVARVRFWNNKRLSASLVSPNLATEVSAYLSSNNYDEFVAEVFTGQMYRLEYPYEVIERYIIEQGPTVNSV